jgi:DNA-binding PadR family transcriptional regulator
LLLLLRDAPSYGYVLRRELAARGLEVEPGTLYRSLRELERDALISSRWMEPAAGPRTRVYTITAEGHACLDELAAVIELARGAQVIFLEAYTERMGGAASAAPPSATGLSPGSSD